MTFKSSENRLFDRVIQMWVKEYTPVDCIAATTNLSIEQVAAMIEAYLDNNPPQLLGALVR